jgi:two-component system, cell cycle sensor histidine kinase and response regulator CckA
MTSASRPPFVLVIDDEPTISQLVCLLLQTAGFRTCRASTESEMSDLTAEIPSIDAILTDMILPWSTGPEIIRDLRQTRPNLPAVIMSGVIDEPSSELAAIIGEHGFVHKPFTPDLLIEAVQKSLKPAAALSPI